MLRSNLRDQRRPRYPLCRVENNARIVRASCGRVHRDLPDGGSSVAEVLIRRPANPPVVLGIACARVQGARMTSVIEAPPQAVTCTTSDPDAAAAFIRSAHGIEGRVAGLRSDRPATLSHVVIGPVSLGTAHLPCSVEFESESSPAFVISHLKSGDMRLGRDTRAETCAAGDIVLALRPGRPCRAHLVDADVALAALTPAALADVVGDEEDGRSPSGSSPAVPARPRRPPSGRPPSTTSPRPWRRGPGSRTANWWSAGPSVCWRPRCCTSSPTPTPTSKTTRSRASIPRRRCCGGPSSSCTPTAPATSGWAKSRRRST